MCFPTTATPLFRPYMPFSICRNTMADTGKQKRAHLLFIKSYDSFSLSHVKENWKWKLGAWEFSIRSNLPFRFWFSEFLFGFQSSFGLNTFCSLHQVFSMNFSWQLAKMYFRYSKVSICILSIKSSPLLWVLTKCKCKIEKFNFLPFFFTRCSTTLSLLDYTIW